MFLQTMHVMENARATKITAKEKIFCILVSPMLCGLKFKCALEQKGWAIAAAYE
jgi:hypothetical protein